LYGCFLAEAAGLLGAAGLAGAGHSLRQVGDAWQDVAMLFVQAANAAAPGEILGEVPPIMDDIAEREADVWTAIRICFNMAWMRSRQPSDRPAICAPARSSIGVATGPRPSLVNVRGTSRACAASC
jgi:hypothetical protein